MKCGYRCKYKRFMEEKQTFVGDFARYIINQQTLKDVCINFIFMDIRNLKWLPELGSKKGRPRQKGTCPLAGRWNGVFNQISRKSWQKQNGR